MAACHKYAWGVCVYVHAGEGMSRTALGECLELDPCWAHSENYPLTRPDLGLCPMTPPHPPGEGTVRKPRPRDGQTQPPAAPGRLSRSCSWVRGEEPEAVSPEARGSQAREWKGGAVALATKH